MLGAVTLGTVGGGLQWRTLRTEVPRPGGYLLASVGAWLLAGVVVLVVAVAGGDAFFRAIGEPDDLTVVGIAAFTAFLLVLGGVGGTVGGVLEGAALRRRLDHGR